LQLSRLFSGARLSLFQMRKFVFGRIERYFRGLGDEAPKIAKRLYRDTQRLNIRYFNDYGEARDIQLVLKPWLIRMDELRFFHKLIYSFKAANDKLFRLYFQNIAVQKTLPLSRREQEWFNLINKGRAQKYQAGFGRWDTNVCFDCRENLREMKFLETNMVGIGGTHYIPVVSEALRSVFKLQLEGVLGPYRLSYQPDARELLAQEIKYHARRIGRRRLNVAFLENREYAGGTIELPELTQYFLRLGIRAVLVDPRELRLKGKEVYYRGTNIDIIYRDAELQELVELEQKGHSMAALKQAFINNQVISSIAGELDHKSGFEIFSSPDFLRYFSPAERRLFARYIPWTRILKCRKTTDPGLRTIDLLPYVIRQKDRLVIKPNRAYGGEGVLIGKLASQKEWRDYAHKAAAHPGNFVVQELVKIYEDRFPFFNADKRIEFDRFYAVAGFVVTRRSIAVLGRFSKEMVVNVARKGGIIPAFLCSRRAYEDRKLQGPDF
jgi:hypothetical protein